MLLKILEVKKLISNRELYERVFCRYIEKGYDEERADYIAARVVSRQKKHLRGQQELVSAGWAPGNMDLGPLMPDGGESIRQAVNEVAMNLRSHPLVHINQAETEQCPRCNREMKVSPVAAQVWSQLPWYEKLCGICVSEVEL
ncbi:MAG: hypothetical protein IB616_01190 [Methanosarcinales archaeon]|nr:MAG: hypothetical protein IB616_01190 [Methanosarcinales archaeon]